MVKKIAFVLNPSVLDFFFFFFQNDFSLFELQHPVDAHVFFLEFFFLTLFSPLRCGAFRYFCTAMFRIVSMNFYLLHFSISSKTFSVIHFCARFSNVAFMFASLNFVFPLLQLLLTLFCAVARFFFQKAKFYFNKAKSNFMFSDLLQIFLS